MHIDKLVEHWTILGEERDLVVGKRGATRLAFAILLKFSMQYGRFPRGRSERPTRSSKTYQGRWPMESACRAVCARCSPTWMSVWSGRATPHHSRDRRSCSRHGSRHPRRLQHGRGRIPYVTGMWGFDTTTGRFAGPTNQDRTRQALINCEHVLRTGGATREDVVEVHVLLARAGDFEAFDKEYATIE
ncbi:Rid family hydrolase [Nonomuraea sp. NPDC048901]|uniref:RidA family protein n=1 Tax=Nonomuraea sp. NPDC048901 TaxID=3155627 RepID=UPI0033DEA89A